MQARKANTKDNVIYWVSTLIIVLFESGGSFWFNSELAKEGTRHLGFPDYFRVEVSIGKIIGGLLLVLPMVPARIKEWAYVAFGITLISATIANWSVDGFSAMVLMPVVFFAILVVSYVYFHKRANRISQPFNPAV